MLHHLLSGQTPKAIKMRLPIGRVDIRIRDWRSTMDHHTSTHIDTNMAYPCRIISADKENQVAGLDLGSRYRRADVIEALGAQPPHT